MKRSVLCLAVLAALSLPALAQGKSGIEKLYILNCGEGVAGDISRWSPGVNVGKSMDFADNCYLIHHAQGWLLWDTGIPDAVASMPDGLAPADPRATHCDAALTLGRAVAGSSAQMKGRALGIYEPSEERRECLKPDEIFGIRLLGRTVPAIRTPDGIRAKEEDFRPASAASVGRCLASKFGGHLEEVRAAM